MQEEISLWDLWKIFKKHVFKIVILTVLGAIVSTVFMMFFVTPKFESRAQLIVVNRQGTSQSEINLGDIQSSVQLINTYGEIITGDSVLSQVNENMGSQYTLGQLKDAVSLQQSQNSQAFNITVTMEAPDEAQNVLNNVIIVFEDIVTEVYDSEDPNIFVLSPPSYNPNKVSPSLPLYVIIGAFLGGVLSLIIVFILEISDTTVKDEDFMASLGLVKLSQISDLSSKDLDRTRLKVSNVKQNRELV